jgi:hypothetical protein
VIGIHASGRIGVRGIRWDRPGQNGSRCIDVIQLIEDQSVIGRPQPQESRERGRDQHQQQGLTRARQPVRESPRALEANCRGWRRKRRCRHFSRRVDHRLGATGLSH